MRLLRWIGAKLNWLLEGVPCRLVAPQPVAPKWLVVRVIILSDCGRQREYQLWAPLHVGVSDVEKERLATDMGDFLTGKRDRMNLPVGWDFVQA